LNNFYFTNGRGKPKEQITRLWFTYHGRILGSFRVLEIVQNDGTNIPKLYKLSSLKSGEPEVSDWQIKLDAWVAVCDEFIKLRERLYI
jgi:putative heme degradation protein